MSGNPETITGGLSLRELEHPVTGQRVTVYRDPGRVHQHLRDHVLSAPESEAWRLLWPPLEESLDFDDPDARWHLLRRAESESGALQDLYDRHVEAVRAEVGNAAALGWHRWREHTTVCLGTGGVVTIFAPMIRTAMIPGMGEPEATRRTQALDATSSCMWRHRPMRGASGAASSRSRRRAPLERERGWDRHQRLYYRVFRPAVQAVRQHHPRSLNVYGQPRHNDVGLLKDVLPRQSELKFQRWRELRDHCGRS